MGTNRRNKYICPKCDSRRVTLDDLERIENGKRIYDPIWICESCQYIGFINLGDTPKGW